MKILRKNIGYIIVLILIVLLCILKQNLVKIVPIYAIAGAVEDDELMVEHALNILNGNWLGTYKYNTLIKNTFFPIFLALCKICSISYINAVTALYSIACIIFMFSIRKIIKNKVYFILMFAILLFNPIMYSGGVLQRVYRNSIIPSLSLIVIGSYIAMFLARNNKIGIIGIFSCVASIGFPCFYYTREDSMWLIPFICFIVFCFIISLAIEFFRNKKYNIKNSINLILKVVFLLLPIIVTSIFGKFIANKNKEYYGLKIVNTYSKSSFSRLMNTINSIKPNEDIDQVTNTKEKLDRMAEVSPSFAKIKPELYKEMKNFQNSQGEVVNGLFMWPFMVAVSLSGYDTLEKENELYIKMNNELNEALDNGKLERQKLMPILGGELLNKEDYNKVLNSIKSAVKTLFDYKSLGNISLSPVDYYQGLYYNMQMFKEITGNRIIFYDKAIDIEGNKLIELKDQDEYINLVNEKISILSNIKKVYVPVAKILQVLGLISYLVLTIITLFNIFKKNYSYIETWIIESSMIGVIFTLVLGIVYTDVVNASVISYFYLCAAYPLFIAFSCISIYNIAIIILKCIKDSKNTKKAEINSI